MPSEGRDKLIWVQGVQGRVFVRSCFHTSIKDMSHVLPVRGVERLLGKAGCSGSRPGSFVDAVAQVLIVVALGQPQHSGNLEPSCLRV